MRQRHVVVCSCLCLSVFRLQVLQFVGVLELETNSIQSATGTLRRALEFAEDGMSLIALGVTAESIALTGDSDAAQQAVRAYVRAGTVLQRAEMDLPVEIWNNLGVFHLDRGRILEASYAFTSAMLSCERGSSLQGAVVGWRQYEREALSTVCANLLNMYLCTGCISAAQKLANGCLDAYQLTSLSHLALARLAMVLNDLLMMQSHVSTALLGIQRVHGTAWTGVVRNQSRTDNQGQTATSVFVASSLLSHSSELHLQLALVQSLQATDCLTDSYRAQCYLQIPESSKHLDAHAVKHVQSSSSCARKVLRCAPGCAVVRDERHIYDKY